MEDHRAIINAFGGGTAMAMALEAIGHEVDRDTIFAWKARNRIPAKHWEPTVKAAKKAKIKGVTLGLLSRLAAAGERGDAIGLHSAHVVAPASAI